MKKAILSVVFLFIFTHLFAQTVITGIIEDNIGESYYYKPFKNFKNNYFPTKIEIDLNGGFKFNLKIDKPFHIKFKSNGIVFSLLVEPKDTLFIHLKPKLFNKNNDNWLMVSGNNAEAHNFYNKTFNYYPITKFENIRNIFSKKIDSFSIENYLNDINLEIAAQKEWLNNLLNKGSITKTFYDYAVYDIMATLSWETIIESEKLIVANIGATELLEKLNIFQEQIFKMCPPNDVKIWSGQYSTAYLYEYYRVLGKTQKIDSSQVISSDVPFYTLARHDEQEYLWGENIWACAELSAEKYNLCEMSMKYLMKFPEGAFAEYLTRQNFCEKKPTAKKAKIIPIYENNFANLISNFKGNNLYIDIWATWCGPCRMEFKNYTEDFYNYLENHKVKLLYFSIDDLKDKQKWEKVVNHDDLKGYHGLLNQELVASMKELVFDGKDISIPRYILVDKNGKVISWNAPRPSDYQLLKLIDSLN